MNMNTKIFLTGDKNRPELYWDMVLIEAVRPILFTCKDCNDNLYICSCHCADSEKCEWIIVPTTCEKVIDLLSNQLTIREIFDCCDGTGFLATLYADHTTTIVKRVKINEIPSHILPTAGFYMDAEDGEFDEEIAELNERVNSSVEVIYIY